MLGTSSQTASLPLHQGTFPAASGEMEGRHTYSTPRPQPAGLTAVANVFAPASVAQSRLCVNYFTQMFRA
jgi:hypothetical protein